MAYRENIDAFVAATNKKEKVFCSAEAFGRFKEDKPLPLSLPRVSFALAKALSDSQEKKMMTSLGDTSEKKKAGKITHYSFQPKLEQIPLIRSLEPLSNDSISVPRGHISLKGLLTFHTLSCIISEFLRVNTYPAFSKFPDDCGEFTFPLRKVGDDGTNYKGYTDAERKKRSFDLEEMSYVHKRRKMMETREEGDVNMDWEGPEEEADTSTIQGKVSTMLHDAVFTAKPSPCPHGTNIGTPNEAPTLPGHLRSCPVLLFLTVLLLLALSLFGCDFATVLDMFLDARYDGFSRSMTVLMSSLATAKHILSICLLILPILL